MKFNFDSDALVMGEEYRQPTGLLWKSVEWMAVVNLIMFGAWAIKWWYFGGYIWMWKAFAYFAPWLLNMVEHGML